MRRFLFLGSVVLIIFLSVTIAYAQSKPVYGGSITIAQGVEPPGLDPTTATSAAIPRVVYGNVLEGLVRIDRNGKIIPALATKYTISKDGKEYTFFLKKGVKFHDGKPFDAEDVKFTFGRLMDPQVAIANKRYYQDIESIEVIDPLTIKFKLKNANSMFLFNLARPDSIIIHKEAADKLKTAPVGTGPFKLVEWARGDRIILEKFAGYHRKGFPYLDKVTLDRKSVV